MKYIRTEKGVYELKNNMSIENAVYCLFGKFEKTNKKHLFRNDKDLGEVVNQADTPEELCDEIVVKENSSSKPRLLKKIVDFDENGNKFYVKGEYGFKGVAYTLKELMEKFKEMSIKGGIWTDEGLKYVFKMNDKGELELI